MIEIIEKNNLETQRKLDDNEKRSIQMVKVLESQLREMKGQAEMKRKVEE